MKGPDCEAAASRTGHVATWIVRPAAGPGRSQRIARRPGNAGLLRLLYAAPMELKSPFAHPRAGSRTCYHPFGGVAGSDLAAGGVA